MNIYLRLLKKNLFLAFSPGRILSPQRSVPSLQFYNPKSQKKGQQNIKKLQLDTKHLASQITTIPKPECFGHFRGIPLFNHVLGVTSAEPHHVSHRDLSVSRCFFLPAPL